jgi:hypothetical protein
MRKAKLVGFVLAPLLVLALVLSLVALPITPAFAQGEVELWHATYDGGDYDEAYGMAVDSEDNIIVTGRYFKGSDFDYYTIKYNPDDNVLCTATVDGGYNDVAYGVAVDSEDNIIVTGYSNDGSTDNYYTIKYGVPPAAGGGLSGGAIAGIVVGTVAAISLFVFAVKKRQG